VPSSSAAQHYGADQTLDLAEPVRSEVEQAGRTAAEWLAARGPRVDQAGLARPAEGGSAAGFTPLWWFALALLFLALAAAVAWGLLSD